MQTQRERLTNLMDSAASKAKLTDKVKCEVSGPQLVMSPNQTGQLEIKVGWQLTLWLEHNRLVGQDPIGVTVAIAASEGGYGLKLPPPALVEHVAKLLLEEARKVRHLANNPQMIPTTEDMLAGMQNVGANGPAQG